MPGTDLSIQTDARRIGGLVLSVMGVAAIAWSTLRPHPAAQLFLAPSCCSFFDVLLNILLFVPLGAGLVMLGLRPRSAALAGALVSVGIEVAQYSWVEGRFASAADVGANVAGALFGVLMVVHWPRRARWWPKVAPAAAVLVVLAWLLGAQVVRPAVPGPAEWVVAWGHAADGPQPFGSTVVDANLQGVPLPPGRVVNQHALRALLAASDTTSLSATIVTGPPSPDTQALFEIKVGQGNAPFIILRQEGQTLRAYQRLELIWVGLSSPWMAMRDAIPTAVGDTVRIRLMGTGKHLRLLVTRGDVVRESSLTLSPDLYLSALFHRTTDGAVWWRLVPAMASFVLLGLALANRPKLLLFASLVALFLSANRAGCAYPEWPVVLAAGLGAWGGWRAGRLLELFRSV